MEPVSDRYEDVALVYMRLVRIESAQAASLIEKIQVDFGYRAALRAALVIVLFKIEVKENHWIPESHIYAYLLDDTPGAVPLLKRAMAYCARAWAKQDLKLVGRPTGNGVNGGK